MRPANDCCSSLRRGCSGRQQTELELNACFEARNETLVALPYSTPNARWMVRRSSFRQNGVPHTLIVLSDVSRALREQERSAWQRLIRVLGHELNNSLAPIISIAGSLASRLPLPELPEAQNADFQRGLNIIESRTAALHRFLQSYRRLAQMPSPDTAARRVAAAAGAGRRPRDAAERRNRIWPGHCSDDRSRPHRADADQPCPQCGGCCVGAGAVASSRLSTCRAEGLHAMGAVRPQGCVDGGRQRHRAAQSEQRVCAVLHDQARAARASDWSCRSRSPRPTAARSSWPIVKMRADAL